MKIAVKVIKDQKTAIMMRRELNWTKTNFSVLEASPGIFVFTICDIGDFIDHHIRFNMFTPVEELK